MGQDVQKSETETASAAQPALRTLAKIKDLTPIVLIVFACVLVFEGVLVKYFVTAEWIDHQLGLTDLIRKNLVKAVDSGYSGTVIFHNKNTSGDAGVEFFSRENQKVSLYVKSVPIGFAAFTPKLRVQINGVDVPFGPDDTNGGLPNTQGGGLMPIDSVIKRASHGEIHTLRITSDDVNSHPDGYLVVNVLVLVSNE
jgi:hypothetical protein